MKTICKFTGLTLSTSSGFDRWAVCSRHPIFTVPLEDLLQMAATSWRPEMAAIEKKLLLLAIAENCELLKWDERDNRLATPAMPSLATIESSITPLLQIAGWIDSQRYANRNCHYPSFLISGETCFMQTFPDMLHRIITNRDVSAVAERKESRLAFLQNHAQNLSARCRIGDHGKEGALLRTTAEWALLITEEALKQERVDNSIRQDWLDMLQTSPAKLKASKFSITDVHELRDFMLDNLPHGSIIAYDVIAHLNRLIECNVINEIGAGDEIFAARILQTSFDTEATNAIAKQIITAKPQRAAFPDIISFARATAAWQLQQLQETQVARQALSIAAAEARHKIEARKQGLESISGSEISSDDEGSI